MLFDGTDRVDLRATGDAMPDHSEISRTEIPGKMAKTTTSGSTRNTTGDEHDRLAASGCLHEVALGCFSCVLGLSAQDLGERGASLDGDGDALSEPRERLQRGVARE